MLYDKRWDKTKADPLKLGTLISWLEQQPAGRRYEYGCNGTCLMAQYFTAMGFRNVVALPGYFEHAKGVQDFSRDMEKVAIDEPYTFGAALARAKALQP